MYAFPSHLFDALRRIINLGDNQEVWKNYCVNNFFNVAETTSHYATANGFKSFSK